MLPTPSHKVPLLAFSGPDSPRQPDQWRLTWGPPPLLHLGQEMGVRLMFPHCPASPSESTDSGHPPLSPPAQTRPSCRPGPSPPSGPWSLDTGGIQHAATLPGCMSRVPTAVSPPARHPRPSPHQSHVARPPTSVLNKAASEASLCPPGKSASVFPSSRAPRPSFR